MATLHQLLSCCQFAFRVEGLASYSIPSEQPMIEEFTRTGKLSSATLADREWATILRQASSRRAQFQRLRLLQQPLTPYQRFELLVYADNVALGEDIRVVPHSDHLFTGDFWLFDGITYAAMRYQDDGIFLGADIEPLRRNMEVRVARWRAVFDTALPLPAL